MRFSLSISSFCNPFTLFFSWHIYFFIVSTSTTKFDPKSLIFSTTHDYVIVGSGSAGCVLSNRLTEDGTNNVLALEAGPRDYWWNWKIHMPAALTYNLCNDNYNWYYHTVPQKNMNDRFVLKNSK